MPYFVTPDVTQVSLIVEGHIPYLKSQQQLAMVNKAQPIRRTFEPSKLTDTVVAPPTPLITGDIPNPAIEQGGEDVVIILPLPNINDEVDLVDVEEVLPPLDDEPEIDEVQVCDGRAEATSFCHYAAHRAKSTYCEPCQ